LKEKERKLESSNFKLFETELGFLSRRTCGDGYLFL